MDPVSPPQMTQNQQSLQAGSRHKSGPKFTEKDTEGEQVTVAGGWTWNLVSWCLVQTPFTLPLLGHRVHAHSSPSRSSPLMPRPQRSASLTGLFVSPAYNELPESLSKCLSPMLSLWGALLYFPSPLLPLPSPLPTQALPFSPWAPRALLLLL